MYPSEIATDKVAESLIRKHFSLESKLVGDYPKTVSLHAFARLAAIKNDKTLREECRQMLNPYITGEVTHNMGSFKHYNIGGNATAYFAWAVNSDALKPLLKEHCDKLTSGHRGVSGLLIGDHEGLLSRFNLTDEQYWIDKLFGTVPFLLFSGLLLGDNSYLDEACAQIKGMVDVFRNPQNGLYHQCYGFTGPGRPGLGKITEDHWSRGNGWGLIALTEMANYLPQTHARRKEMEKIFTDHVVACLKFQDKNGLWHQEMTRTDSFVETSGSGFILYALGVALEKKLLAQKETEKLLQGLRGMASYIGMDSSMHNTCEGCCCPGKGMIADYMAKPHPMNDPHGFGPVSLAFSQAYNLGIKSIAIA